MVSGLTVSVFSASSSSGRLRSNTPTGVPPSTSFAPTKAPKTTMQRRSSVARISSSRGLGATSTFKYTLSPSCSRTPVCCRPPLAREVAQALWDALPQAAADEESASDHRAMTHCIPDDALGARATHPGVLCAGHAGVALLASFRRTVCSASWMSRALSPTCASRWCAGQRQATLESTSSPPSPSGTMWWISE